MLDRKASLTFLNAPLASLASLARSLRSSILVSYRWLFLCFSMLVMIFEIVSISVDLSWMFMPTWPHVS